MSQIQVPKDWELKKLENIGDIITGSTPSTKISEYYGNDFPFYKPADLDLGDQIDSSKDGLSKKGLKEARFLPANSILVTCIGTIGKTSMITKAGACNQQINAIIVKLETTIPKFVFYWIKTETFQNLMKKNATKTTLPILNKSKFKNLFIPIPPIKVQKKIVQKLDYIFEQFEKNKKKINNLVTSNRLSTLSNSIHQAMLFNAFSGHFTNEWRKKNPNPESILGFIQKMNDEKNQTNSKNKTLNLKLKITKPKKTKLPSTWELIPSYQLFRFVTSGSRDWAKYYSEDGPVFIRISNLQKNSIDLDLTSLKHVQLPEKVEGKRTRLDSGDILISITADIGIVGLVRSSIPESYVNQHIALARPLKGLNAEYLAWYLSSTVAYKQFKKYQRGATKTGLGLDDIRSIWIPLPPVAEQNEIVKKINEKTTSILPFIKINLIKELQVKLQDQFNKLPIRILNQVFSGRLVN